MILHIAAYSAKHIIFPYIEFIHKNFNPAQHHFILCSAEILQIPFGYTQTFDIFTQADKIIQAMQKAEKIILHGIWYDILSDIYQQNKQLLSKTFWIPWGGEYHFPDKVSQKNRWLFQNIPYIVTYLNKDYQFIQEHYHTMAQQIVSINYPSNLFHPLETEPHNGINLLVGNSANPTNKHSEILQKLLPFRTENIRIFIPLVYGDSDYANKVEFEARKLFGAKAIILKEFMNFERYRYFLATIDIAIFNHHIQEAAGNTTTLLGLGAKVYLNKKSTLLQYFQQIDTTIYANTSISLTLLSDTLVKKNKTIIRQNFSKEELFKSLHTLFTLKL